MQTGRGVWRHAYAKQKTDKASTSFNLFKLLLRLTVSNMCDVSIDD